MEASIQHYIGLDVSQQTRVSWIVDDQRRRHRRGGCASPEVEAGSTALWLVHELRSVGLVIDCLDARRVNTALEMQLNKTDENNVESLARSNARHDIGVNGKALTCIGAGSPWSPRSALVCMTTPLFNMRRGI